MKNKNHSITSIYKHEIDDSELDLVLRDEVLGDNWDDEEEKYGRTERITLNNSMNGWQGEFQPISIEKLKKHIAELEEKGCNYMEIFYHCDHMGYNIYGLDIHRSTDKEIADFKKNKDIKKVAEKEAKIKKLKDEIKKIEKS